MSSTTADTPPLDAPEVVAVGDELVTLPVEVRSAKMFAATFLVDADAAQRLIDDTGLRVSRPRPGTAVCALSAVQYLDNDLGPYNEIAVAFTVDPHDLAPGAKAPSPMGGNVSTLIHRLPVNQTFTCEAGRGVWGFPKWVATIDYTDHGRWTDAVLVDDGEFVLGLSARKGVVPLPAREMTMSAYSWSDGVLRRTPWVTDNRRVTARPGGVVVQLGATHPMARELADLGLPKRAVFCMTAGLMRASFGPAEIVSA